MKEDIAAAWIEELESGRKAQGYGALRTVENPADFYCCLGVLSEMAVEAGVIPAGRRSGYAREERARYGYGAELDTATLCPEVRDWAGIRTRWGSYGDGECLSADNDAGRDFAYIAQVIRKNVEEL